MGDIIQLSDGRITGFYPTTTQEEIDRAKAEDAAVNAKGSAYEARRMKEEAARLAAIPKGEERLVLAVEGLRKKIRQLRRTGDKRAAKASKYADAAATALEEYQKNGKKLRAKHPDPLGDAKAAAVKELRSKLPNCFPTDADALLFAGRNLPLQDATHAAEMAANEYAKVSRKAKVAKDAYWREIEAAGRLVFGSLDDDANARLFVELGE